jgi:hypothetical protein
VTDEMTLTWLFRPLTQATSADPVIDTLIKPPRQIFSGGGWENTHKLIPRGDAETDRLVASRLEQEGRRNR